MLRRLLASVLAILVAACAVHGPTPASSSVPLTHRPLGDGEIWLPTFPTTTADGTPIACGGVGFPDGYRLHGASADPHLAWMIRPDGSRQELVWPAGYSARFRPNLEILDDKGALIALEGSRVTGGCGMPPGDSMWVDFALPE